LQARKRDLSSLSPDAARKAITPKLPSNRAFPPGESHAESPALTARCVSRQHKMRAGNTSPNGFPLNDFNHNSAQSHRHRLGQTAAFDVRQARHGYAANRAPRRRIHLYRFLLNGLESRSTPKRSAVRPRKVRRVSSSPRAVLGLAFSWWSNGKDPLRGLPRSNENPRRAVNWTGFAGKPMPLQTLLFGPWCAFPLGTCPTRQPSWLQ
jgi:hypothetical protein